MDYDELQGWHSDPFGLHELRYFSAGRPTRLVRDGGVETYDEPPDLELTAPSTGDETHVGSGSPGSRHGRSGEAGPVRRRRYGLASAVIAVAAVGVLLAVFALQGGSARSRGSASRGMTPAAFVTSSAQRTLAENTVDVTMSATVHVGGYDVALHGSGQLDMANDAMTFDIGTSSRGMTLAEHEVLTGGNLYFEVIENGQNPAVAAGGRHWVEIPTGQTAAQTITGPVPSLTMLEQRGLHVTPIGSKTIDGRSCTGYQITPTKQALISNAKQDWGKEGLSSADTTPALQALQGMSPPTLRFWFDSQQLACEADFAMQIGSSSSAESGGVQMVMLFTNYGAPVQVTAPAPGDTITFQQFLQGAAGQSPL